MLNAPSLVAFSQLLCQFNIVILLWFLRIALALGCTEAKKKKGAGLEFYGGHGHQEDFKASSDGFYFVSGDNLLLERNGRNWMLTKTQFHLREGKLLQKM